MPLIQSNLILILSKKLPNQTNFIALALGSNQGNRKANLKKAIAMLGIYCLKISPIYETKALLPSGAPKAWDIPFLNIAAVGKINKPPQAILTHLKRIEEFLGRTRNHIQWSPRTIDIDIIFYQNSVITSPLLTIPHKEMHKRYFVLKPLCDIIPNYVHPVYKKTIAKLLEDLSG